MTNKKIAFIIKGKHKINVMRKRSRKQCVPREDNSPAERLSVQQFLKVAFEQHMPKYLYKREAESG